MRRVEVHLIDRCGLVPIHGIADFEIVTGLWIGRDGIVEPDLIIGGYYMRVSLDADLAASTFAGPMDRNEKILDRVMPGVSSHCQIIWSRIEGRFADVVVADRSYGEISDADVGYLALLDRVAPNYSIEWVSGSPSRGFLSQGRCHVRPVATSKNFFSISVFDGGHKIFIHEVLFSLPVVITPDRPKYFVHNSRTDDLIKRDLFGDMRSDIVMFRRDNEFRFVSRVPFSEADLDVFRAVGVEVSRVSS